MISGLCPAHLLGHKQLLVLGPGMVTVAHLQKQQRVGDL